jgi:hypothetical protein
VEYPLKESTTYDPDITTDLEAFIQVARGLAG